MSHSTEIAFLPAALELQETPPAPLGRTILWTILAFFTAAVAWASFGHVDIVAVAQGRIIPSGHSKIVQPLEIGTVKAINVAEGQSVNAGDILIELDPSSTQADVTQFVEELAAARREVERLTTLIAWIEGGGEQPIELAANGPDPLLLSQWLEYRDRLAVLERERDRRTAERRSAQRQVDKLTAILPLITRRASDQKGLAEKKLLAEQQYLETEQERIELVHDLRTQRSRVAELDAAAAELQARAANTRSEFKRRHLENLEQARRRTIAAEQQLVKARTRAKAQVITAPVDGVVQQLAVHSVGAVVTPAQNLMVLVPQGEGLEVEAMLENKDIGFVEPSQIVAIKIEAFPFTRYGMIGGEIIDLSDDALADEKAGLVYKMRVRLADTALMVNGKSVALSPGMAVTVETKTGTRRLIEYFLSPLLRYKDESVRER